MNFDRLVEKKHGNHKKKIRIVQLIDAQGGGALTHVLTLAKHMPKEQVEIFIVFFISGPALSLAKQLGIPVIVLKKHMLLDIHFIWRLYRFLKKEDIDIIHTHTINSNFYGRVAAKLAKIPVITTTHSYMIDELKGLKSNPRMALLFFQIDKIISNWSDKFIAVSPGIKRRLLDHGVPLEKIEVIPHGVDIPSSNKRIDITLLRKASGIRPSSTVVAIIGRLVPVKNHRIFLDAASKVVKKRKNIQFLVVGDGILRKDIEQYAEELSIRKHVIFTGWRNDMDDLYRIIDILVLCSSTESQGLAILEAMAHRKAVIATDVDEIGKTVVNEETGLLVSPENTTELSQAIERLIDEPFLRKKLGENGRILVEKSFSVSVMIERVLNLYERIFQFS